MRITVVGTGYVGLVTGVCLADSGNHVVCVDVDDAKIARLQRGESTIFEPGLQDLLSYNIRVGRLCFTTDLESAVRAAQVVFVAVGTPPRADGDADLTHVDQTALAVARAARHELILVIKSTVPVGTAERLAPLVRQQAAHPVHVVSNPEFLKEGSAVADFQRPGRVVIGAFDDRAAAVIKELYEPFVRNNNPILIVPPPAAEMIKYVANSYLAMRITFANQIAELCGACGVDFDDVRRGIGADNRIGIDFLYPGIGYGGSCFPKDVPALCHVGRRKNVQLTILEAVHKANERQPTLLLDAARSRFGDSLHGRTFAVWGVAFKPRTDDVREAPARRIIDELRTRGAAIRVHDPKALANLREAYGDQLVYCEEPYEALAGADALFVCTEWTDYRSPDFDRIRAALRQPVIFDGRNVYSMAQMRRHGFEYYSIGRPPLRGSTPA